MGDIKEHYSFLCRIQLGMRHKPCSGSCDCNDCYILWLEQEIDPIACMCECHKGTYDAVFNLWKGSNDLPGL